MQNKKIQLTKGKVAIVNDEDHDSLNQYKWYSYKNKYAVRTDNRLNKTIMMHKLSNKWQAYITVDYKRKHLGLFSDKNEAKNVYKEAAKKYFGKFSYAE